MARETPRGFVGSAEEPPPSGQQKGRITRISLQAGSRPGPQPEQPLLESSFEFLFKYRPVVFERGEFAFGVSTTAALVLAVVCAALAVAAIVGYRSVRAGRSGRDRAVLASLRVAIIAVLFVCLLRPSLLLSTAVPQRNVVGVLIDDSRSMSIADGGIETRGDQARRIFAGPDSTLLAALSERFIVRFFRFSDVVQRAAPGELSFGGKRTLLGRAIEGAREELGGVPVAGLVLVSDGADNTPAGEDRPQLDEAISSLRASAIPVHTVGVGSTRLDRDIEISRASLPREVLEGSVLVADLSVVQRGYAGRTVTLVAEDSGRIVATQELTLPADGEPSAVRIQVPAMRTGARLLSFRIAPQAGEMIAQNNVQHALVTVQGRREKILYLEGEPRFELKFIRRAVVDDERLQLVTMQRTAEGKFLRLSVDDSLELLGGFPATREELYAYRGVVLGSIEASFFTVEQLRMLADFVSERGGGLLVLGGRRALGEGGFAGTPLADALPIELDALGTGRDDRYFVELSVAPSAAGAGHAVTQIGGSEKESAARWATMPPLSAVNRVGRVKPGATVLLNGATTAGTDRQPVLAYQRFGRGKSVAFPVQDSWMWQMHADIPVEDMTHETFWRQMLRWLVNGVPGRVSVVASAEHVAPGETAALRAEVADAMFRMANDAETGMVVTSPSGARTELVMDRVAARDGEYASRFVPDEPGVHEIRATARRGAETIAGDPVFVRVAEPLDEYFDAAMRPAVLERIARETGGRYYTPATVGTLAGDMMYTQSGTTVVERRDLWDMPVVFLLLVGLMTAEWGYRRKRGLA